MVAPLETKGGGLAKDMTLRDWFAGQALAGLCSMADATGTWQWDKAGVAHEAYAIANALLIERERGE